MKKLILYLIFNLSMLLGISQGIVIDHTSTDIDQIPISIVEDIKDNIKWQYGSLSHGNQLLCGILQVEDENAVFNVEIGGEYYCCEKNIYSPPYLPNVPGALCLYSGANGMRNLGAPANGNWDNFMYHVQMTFNQNPTLNVFQFQWCGEIDTWTETQVQNYLTAMQNLENANPNVTVVYTTGHAQSGGSGGYNRYIRNNQIRQWCIDNNKFCYDFGDLDSWYNGEQATYLFNGQQIPIQHSAYNGNDCHHTNDLNCYYKGKAVWWMMSQIIGWSPVSNQQPVIENQVFGLNENMPNGTEFGSVLATDPDVGQTLTYSIIGGNTNSAFQINASTGILSVNNSLGLDYESLNTFGLTVRVQDNGQGNLFSQAIITINLTDVNEVPIINNQTFIVPENSPDGHQVGFVEASDPDDGQSLFYTIIGGNIDDAFELNSTTGELIVANSNALILALNLIFDLTVEVIDNGSGNLNSQAIVSVSVTEVNQSPVIINQTFSITENSPNGQQVGVVVASDPDAGQTLTYSIISGNTNNAFAINAGTGALSVNNTTALNYETITTFGLTVRATDNGTGSLYSQATVTVNLTNVNENPNIGNQTFSIAENSPNGQQVGVVVASDPDAGQTLTYSIIIGNTGNAFAINAGTGALSVNNSTALNYETITTFGLTVRATDNGTGSLYSQATVTVNLTNVNENPNIGNQTFSIAENSPNGQQVGVVVAIDPDAGQTLSYSIISGNTSNAFAINTGTGALSVNNSTALNYEAITTFGLIVRATDNGTGSLYSQATVTVNLTNVNENPNISNQTFTIEENSPNGQQVGLVIASDPDAGQTLSYSIINGNTANVFAINTSTGELIVNNVSVLNFELYSIFTLTIRAQDNGEGMLYSQAVVVINLIDVNEKPEMPNQVFWVTENTANGELVGVVVANDPDNGQSLVFTILDGNTDNAFELDPITGELIVSNSSALNSELNPVFSMTVQASDDGLGNLNSEATVTVNVTDEINQPPMISDQTFSLAENSPNGQQVGIVIATDPDAGQTLSYSIMSGNTSNAFAIDETTGALSVNNGTALNFETITTFGLIVRATDNGTGSLYSQAIVTVNLTDVNENPNIINQTFSIAENSTNGQQVGIVIATDPDAGQTLTYSIISGNTDNAFAINTGTGALSVNNGAALNFETITAFGLTVRATDNGQGTLYSQATVAVNVMDVNENPYIGNQTFSIAENSPNGQQIGIVIATDPDAGQTLNYSITSGNISDAFTINSNTGALSVNNSTALNFETITVIGLTVRATDNGQGTLYSQATVAINLTDVNENPYISNQTFAIEENSPNGHQVGMVVASDPDAGQTLTYSIVSGNTGYAFAINASTGVLSVNNSTILNFETITTFGLTIRATDNGQGTLYSQATVAVNLTDVNENPDISNQTFSIAENSSNGQQVGLVVASDPDAGQTLNYSIISGNTSDAFAINASTGVLSVDNSAALNFETVTTFGLTVRAQDNGQGTLYSQAAITININNVNEPPVLEPLSMEVTLSAISYLIDEQVVIFGDPIEAFDPDAGQTLTYTIAGGNDRDIFAIDPVTGQMRIINTHSLNLIAFFEYPLLIRVIDNAPEQLFADAVLTVTVQFINIGNPLSEGNPDESLTNIDNSAELPVICNLYPNPANNFIQIEAENLEQEIVNLTIIGMTGEVLYKEALDAVEGRFFKLLEIDHLSKGLYFVNIRYGEKMIVKKFVKQ